MFPSCGRVTYLSSQKPHNDGRLQRAQVGSTSIPSPPYPEVQNRALPSLFHNNRLIEHTERATYPRAAVAFIPILLRGHGAEHSIYYFINIISITELPNCVGQRD